MRRNDSSNRFVVPNQLCCYRPPLDVLHAQGMCGIFSYGLGYLMTKTAHWGMAFKPTNLQNYKILKRPDNQTCFQDLLYCTVFGEFNKVFCPSRTALGQLSSGRPPQVSRTFATLAESSRYSTLVECHRVGDEGDSRSTGY